MPRNLLIALLLASSASTWTPDAALGATIVHITDERLCAMAPAIVGGEVVSLLAQVRPGTHQVVTRAQFRIDRVLKGKDVPGEIAIRIPGGSVPDRTTRVPGAPRFRVGERSILFIRPGRDGDGRILGLSRGKFDIVADPETGTDWIVQDTEGLNQIVLEGRLAPERYLMKDGEGRVPLDEFLATLDEVVAQCRDERP